ncbi:MAG: hypothetical protein MJA83_15530 [Gammaproteobacteria bacterium]|nr:hypothetical protein [Gammaproteobacteria bacterium]
MPTIPPFKDRRLPDMFLRWLEQLREILRPVPTFRQGTGSPEGAVKGSLNDRYYQTDGAAGSRLWYKSTDGGDTGWVNYA